jgi:PAS domain S-box-containing protein
MNPEPKEPSHDECQAALNAIPDLIFQIKDDGTFLNYKGARDDLYVPPEQFIGKKVQDILPEQLARQTLEYMGLALESKKIQIYEYNLTIGDHLKYFEARMIAYEKDKVIAVIRDITGRKRAQEKLGRSEEYFRALIEDAEDIVTVLDGQGVVKYQSPNYRRIWGRDPSGEVGKDLYKDVHPDDISLVSEKFSYLLKDRGSQVNIQIRAKREDGSWRFLEVIGKNLIDNSAVRGIVVNFRDITERKRVEEELRDKMQELKLINDAAVGRELKMVELEKEVDRLLNELGRAKKYGE